ncbi:16S rRNA (uracil(1498)-N(3))-methyltransferase [Rapidithrix thailandica]|uniref:Ribosomal RNA small subunit methyltransferase E n=1 Tax=Rapidithrix thailandica TaxID=413964 RepID=A0AAW9S871_9BACT
MRLFYSEDITPESQQIQLAEEDSRHCIKVLKAKKSDSITLIDGNGYRYQGIVEEPHPKRCLIAIEQCEKIERKRSNTIHIAISPTKNMDRIEWFVEKCVEIGVDKLSFFISEHSVRNKMRLDRIKKIAVAAMKQSINFYLPEIHDVMPYDTFLKEIARQDQQEQRFIAYVPTDSTAHLATKAKAEENYCILIGPEGGFSEQEVALAQSQGFQTVSLGENRLRTETAGVVACNILNLTHLMNRS